MFTLLLLLLPALCLSLSLYRDLIPNGRSVKSLTGNVWPGVGHTSPNGGGPRNQFGMDFAAQGYTWTNALCHMDSDSDGATNGYELGDPQCVWAPGGAPPARTINITHPGFAGDAYEGAIDTCADWVAPANTFNASIRFSAPFTLPAGRVTSYPRQAFDLSSVLGVGNTDAWGLRFEPIVDGRPDVVHHMLLYSCTSSQVGTYLAGPTDPSSMGCSGGLLWAWAIGGGAMCLPANHALKFLTTNSASSRVLLEVHMNNAAQDAGISIRPGFKITMVSQANALGLKPCNWLWTGVPIGSINIPPGKPFYELTATHTFKVPFYYGTVSLNPIAYAGHTHMLGKKIWVERRRSVSDNINIACQPTYSNENQDIIPLQLGSHTITGTDTLVVHCVYDSSTRIVTTFGGEETNDEMCFVFILFQTNTALLQNTLPVFAGGTTFSTTTVTSSETPQITMTSCVEASALGSGTGSGTGSGGTYSPVLPVWLTAHIVLGAVSFGFLLPLGTLIPASSFARSFPYNAWFQAHRGVLIISLLAAFSAFGLGIAKTPSQLRLKSTHGKMGLALVILCIVQGFMGALRPHLPSDVSEVKTLTRKVWEIAHPFLGRVIVVLCAVQTYLGYTYLDELWYFGQNTNLLNWTWGHTIGIFVLWFVVLVSLKVHAHFHPAVKATDENEKSVPVAVIFAENDDNKP